jgi:hypothetical protein
VTYPSERSAEESRVKIDFPGRAASDTVIDPLILPPHCTAWSDLPERLFEVNALRCPGCGGRMRVLSAITDANVAGAILRCLALPARAPPPAARDDVARGSVLAADESFSETSAFDFDQFVEIESAESSF